ncbi:MAG TPA: hypothetical protein VKA46_03850 [Gemmataceae bacterium]|nr:hypothetical protein [Gemmataceae bacterium]
MIVVSGTNYFGVVDRVPGLYYVATRFFHVGYMPIMPLESYLIFTWPGQTGRRGRRIPLSPKSVLVGWVRGACGMALWLTVVCSLLILLAMDRHHMHASDGRWLLLRIGAVFAVSGAVLAMTIVFNKASPRRAAELRKYLEPPKQSAYDRLTTKDKWVLELEEQLTGNPDPSPQSQHPAGREGAGEPPGTAGRAG